MLVVAIVACEVAFWAFLATGLGARYLLRRPKLGMALLLGSPTADVGLLTLTAVDLQGGATAGNAHGLAALYIGFTVAFGHRTVRWADARFAHRFAGGPAPVKPPRRGPGRVEHEQQLFRRALLGGAVSSALLGVLVVIAGDVDRAEALLGYLWILGVVLVVWYLTAPLWVSQRDAVRR